MWKEQLIAVGMKGGLVIVLEQKTVNCYGGERLTGFQLRRKGYLLANWDDTVVC